MGSLVDAFEHFRSAWYGDHHMEADVFDEVRFGRYPKANGPAVSTIAVRWRRDDLAGAKLLVDSPDWPLLDRYRQVLQELAGVSNRAVTPADVIGVLKDHGFEDRTELVDNVPLFDLVEAN